MTDDFSIDFSRFLDDYLNDAREGFQTINNALLALEKDFSRTDLLDEVFRVFHTMKSSSVMLEFTDIAALAHIAEDLLDLMRRNEAPVTRKSIDVLFELADTLEAMIKERSKKRAPQGADGSVRISDFQHRIAALKEKAAPFPSPAGKEGVAGSKGEVNKQTGMPAIEKVHTVRVPIDLLDSMFNIIGEIIIVRNRIENIVAAIPGKELKSTLSGMNRLISELQDNVSAARMVPAGEIFEKFPRMVRDLAREERKEIDFILEGNDIELDKAILDAIGEPVLHLLRNAIDHGIELPAERQSLGKNIRGKLRLTAKRTENHIVIEVEDDGRGIDALHIMSVAVKKGFAKQEDEPAKALEKRAIDMIFHPSFSTAEEVTGTSGRGVGLHIVKTAVREMGGSVDIAARAGKGVCFTLKLPLSTAIMQMIMVSVSEQAYGIPSDMVIETMDIKKEDIRDIHTGKALILRKEVIPFVLLHDVLNITVGNGQESFIAIIVRMGNKITAVGVDAVLDQMENIVKPLDPVARQWKGFSGGMILGDGRVALLLDLPALLKAKRVKYK